MDLKTRSAIAATLRIAADSLEGKKPKKKRMSPHFRTTDEMLKWALEHKGEKDPPAPDIEVKDTTEDSEIPETFGRIMACTCVPTNTVIMDEHGKCIGCGRQIKNRG